MLSCYLEFRLESLYWWGILFTRVHADNIHLPIEGHTGHYIPLVTQNATYLKKHLTSYWKFY